MYKPTHAEPGLCGDFYMPVEQHFYLCAVPAVAHDPRHNYDGQETAIDPSSPGKPKEQRIRPELNGRCRRKLRIWGTYRADIQCHRMVGRKKAGSPQHRH